MSYLMISHKVANYAKWKRGVAAAASGASVRRKIFLRLSQQQASERPDGLVRVGPTARMKKFAQVGGMRKAMKEVGVVGQAGGFFLRQDGRFERALSSGA